MKSMIAIIIFANTSLFFGIGCTKHASQNPTIATQSFLAIGDSYTIGELAAENERFPAQTSAILQQENLKIGPITYVAKTGWRTDQILASVNSTSLQSKYDIVTLLAGVNDQYQDVDTGTYRANFTALLEKAIVLSGNNVAHVFVLSMPDYSATPFVPTANKPGVSAEIDIFNGINKQIVEAHQCVYLDITPSTRLMQNDNSLVASDGLHPTGKEYAVWAKALAPLINAGIK